MTTDQTTPTEPTWDDVFAAIGREFWKLAPQDYRESGHRDLVFGVCWQNLMAAVDTAVESCFDNPAQSEGGNLRELIEDLTDPDPCEFDHHGYCQAHGWMQTEARCPHARAQELLAAAAVKP